MIVNVHGFVCGNFILESQFIVNTAAPPAGQTKKRPGDLFSALSQSSVLLEVLLMFILVLVVDAVCRLVVLLTQVTILGAVIGFTASKVLEVNSICREFTG